MPERNEPGSYSLKDIARSIYNEYCNTNNITPDEIKDPKFRLLQSKMNGAKIKAMRDYKQSWKIHGVKSKPPVLYDFDHARMLFQALTALYEREPRLPFYNQELVNAGITLEMIRSAESRLFQPGQEN